MRRNRLMARTSKYHQWRMREDLVTWIKMFETENYMLKRYLSSRFKANCKGMYKEWIQRWIIWFHWPKGWKWYSHLQNNRRNRVWKFSTCQMQITENYTGSALFITILLFRKRILTLQNPTFVLILAKYILLCVVSAEGPASRIRT